MVKIKYYFALHLFIMVAILNLSILLYIDNF